MRAALLTLLLLCSSSAFADDDELALDASVGLEAAVLTNPYEGPLSLKPIFAARPRVALAARYGWTNSIYTGVRVDGTVALSPSTSPHLLTTPAVSIETFNGDLVSTAGSAALLATAGYRLDLGWNYTAIFEVQAGPALAVWYHHHLAVPGSFDAAGKPIVYLGPGTIPLTVLPGGLVRLQAAFEARLFEHLLLVVMPYVSAGWIGGVDVAGGISARVSWMFSPWLS